MMLFTIPLKPKGRGNWDAVCRHLGWTLESLVNQTDPAWMAAVAYVDKPENMPTDSRIAWLRRDMAPGIADKGLGMAAAYKHWSKTVNGLHWVMPLDADDLLHKDWVRFAHSTGVKEPNVLLRADRGYVFSAKLCRIKPHGGLYGVCGSCNVVSVDYPAGCAEDGWPVDLRGTHKEVSIWMPRKAKITIPPGYVIYVMEHGGNCTGGNYGVSRSGMKVPEELLGQFPLRGMLKYYGGS